MTAEASEHPSAGRGRALLVGLFALFAIPIVVAYLLNVAAPHWLPFGQVNRGDLVTPPVDARFASVRQVADADLEPPAADAAWAMVHPTMDSACGSDCEQALVNIRQARIALGEDAHRVQRWWIVTHVPAPGAVARVRRIDPGLRIGVAGRSSPLFDSVPPAPIQVIDPAGYLILRYREPASAGAVLKDLERLLRISAQG